MDQRQTFGDLKELQALLEEVKHNDAPARLLIDKNGLERLNCHVLSIEENEKGQRSALLDSDLFPAILLKEIVAVNGIFRSDYSEC